MELYNPEEMLKTQQGMELRLIERNILNGVASQSVDKRDQRAPHLMALSDVALRRAHMLLCLVTVCSSVGASIHTKRDVEKVCEESLKEFEKFLLSDKRKKDYQFACKLFDITEEEQLKYTAKVKDLTPEESQVYWDSEANQENLQKYNEKISELYNEIHGVYPERNEKGGYEFTVTSDLEFKLSIAKVRDKFVV